MLRNAEQADGSMWRRSRIWRDEYGRKSMYLAREAGGDFAGDGKRAIVFRFSRTNQRKTEYLANPNMRKRTSTAGRGAHDR